MLSPTSSLDLRLGADVHVVYQTINKLRLDDLSNEGILIKIPLIYQTEKAKK